MMCRRWILVWSSVAVLALVGSGCSGDAGCGADSQCGDAAPDPDPGTGGPGRTDSLAAGGGALADPTGAADFLLDFGTIARLTERTLAFPLLNDGTAAVALAVTDPGDHFAVAAAPSSLAAGESGALYIAYQPVDAASHEAIVTVSAGTESIRIRLVGAAVQPALSCPPVAPSTLRLGSSDVVEVRCSNTTSVEFDVMGSLQGGGIHFVDVPSRFAPGAEAVFTFGPSIAGTWSNTLVLTDGVDVIAEVDFDVQVFRGPNLECHVYQAPFEGAVVGMSPTRTPSASCYNHGDMAAEILSVTTSGGPFQVAPFQGTVGPHQRASFDLTFAPPAVGPYSGQLVVEAAPPLGQIVVALAGSAIELPPCELEVLPATPALDFFVTRPNRAVHQEITLRSGPNGCAIRDLTADMPWAVYAPEAIDLAPNSETVVQIAFVPFAEGSYAGALRYRVSDPANEMRTLPLTGAALATCLEFEPGYYVYSVPADCGHAATRIAIRNGCAGPVAFDGATAHGSDGGATFAVLPPPASVLAPGDTLELDVTYSAGLTSHGSYGGVTVSFDGIEHWLELVGETVAGHSVDYFYQVAPPTDAFPLAWLIPMGSDMVRDVDVWVDGVKVKYEYAANWRYLRDSSSILFPQAPAVGSTIKVAYQSCDIDVPGFIPAARP